MMAAPPEPPNHRRIGSDLYATSSNRAYRARRFPARRAGARKECAELLTKFPSYPVSCAQPEDRYESCEENRERHGSPDLVGQGARSGGGVVGGPGTNPIRSSSGGGTDGFDEPCRTLC